MEQNSLKGTPILKVENLTRVVDGRTIVDGVNLEVFPEDVLAVVGPSGAGKSSFLRLLNRLDEPTEGSILLNGVDYRSILPRELRQRIGMVMQKAVLFPGTVEENVRFGPRQQGGDISSAEIEELLEHVNLPGFSTRSVQHLSGGEAQRVSLARALANHPDILLLDEPTSALDEAARERSEVLILSVIRERGIPCLMVTHDLLQAARMASRVVVLEEGRIVRQGIPQEVLNA